MPGRRQPPTRLLALAAVAAVGYGLAVELVQATLAYRTFALADLAANAVGAVVGVLPVGLADRREWL